MGKVLKSVARLAGPILSFVPGLNALGIALTAISSLAIGIQERRKAKRLAREAAARESGILVSAREAAAPRRIVYGQRVVGGNIVFWDTTGSGNEYLHVVYYLCEGPIEEIGDVMLGPDTLTLDGNGNATDSRYSGVVQVKKHLGGASQSADSDLVSRVTNWTSDHRLLGCAYVYIRFQFSESKFAQGLPNATFKIKGRNDVYDPRDTSNKYTSNSALCLDHYLTLSRVGPNASYANEIDETALIAAANVCEESVSLAAGGSENRYETHGVIFLDDNPEDIIRGLVDSMAGSAVYIGGKWVIRAGQYITPTFTIDSDILIGAIDLRNKAPKKHRFNTVRGLYIAATKDWQPTNYPARSKASYVTADGEELIHDLSLNHTTSVSMAQRIANIELERGRLQKRLTLACSLEAFRTVTGSTVLVNLPRYSLNNQAMEVLAWSITIQDLVPVVNLELAEIGSSVFNWSTSDEIAVTVPTKPDIQDSSTTPTPTTVTPSVNIAVYGASTGYAGAHGRTNLEVKWSNPTDADTLNGGKAYVELWEVGTPDVYLDQKTVDADKGTQGVAFGNVQVNKDHKIKLRFFNRYNVPGSVLETTYTTTVSEETRGQITSSTFDTLDEWSFNHNFQTRPSVKLYNTSDEEIQGGVTISSTNVTASFASAISGYMVLTV